MFLSALVHESEQQGMKHCQQLAYQYSAFASILNEFGEQLRMHKMQTHFTQSQSDQYRSESDEVMVQLKRYATIVLKRVIDLLEDRMARNVVPSQNFATNRRPRLERLISLSDVQQSHWYQEIERLRQSKQVQIFRPLLP